MLHLYSYDGENKVQPHLVIEAHIGSVNDLAFASTSEQLSIGKLSIVTGGEDKLLRCGMWLLVPICLLLKGMRLLYFVFAFMSWKIFILFSQPQPMEREKHGYMICPDRWFIIMHQVE